MRLLNEARQSSNLFRNDDHFSPLLHKEFMVKTFENYLDKDRLLLEQSCDDGSIVKVEVYSQTLKDWVDCTEKGKLDGTVRRFAEECWNDYLQDRKILACKSKGDGINIKELFKPIIFGNDPKDVA